MQSGEISMAAFGPAGPHPVIVVSREELNRGHYALVVVCTSARFATRSKLANCVPFQAGEFGFTVDRHQADHSPRAVLGEHETTQSGRGG